MTYKKITPKELHVRLNSDEKLVLLDVRAEEKFNEFHIKESRNLPKTVIFQLDEKEDAELSLPKDQEIIVTCTTGNSAAKCAAILDNLDYSVTVLDGGLTGWKEYLSSLED
ncbi:rhodanese [Neobacillus bataviensis LMG 21833]|uniref:Rhodanese n=1 Tax=Neobacillus bataviensis LMG 21833 TaxID=1117379 RepID=K6DD02_9BACI|nr:rhodanese-like domain-containing protein [Neobacillus bataviensis]EKN66194.1 rhodanese [Neobacillus bataviensis LMG 21833]